MNGNAGALPQTGELTQAVKRERYLHRFRMTIRSTFLSLVVVAAVAVLVAVLLLPILRIYGKSMHGTLDSGDINKARMFLDKQIIRIESRQYSKAG